MLFDEAIRARVRIRNLVERRNPPILTRRSHAATARSLTMLISLAILGEPYAYQP